MFLAAAPYFQTRFAASPPLLAHFQPSIIFNSTLTSLLFITLLTSAQRNASYPTRISAALLLNTFIFLLLALSTRIFTTVSPKVYFAFLMLMVFLSSCATALLQNGLFAYVLPFGMPEYTQGIMVGQGVAGVLPCLAQIGSVLSVPDNSAGDEGEVSPKSALAYFLTATFVSVGTLGAFGVLAQRRRQQVQSEGAKQRIEGLDEEIDEGDELMTASALSTRSEKPVVGILALFRKLRYISLAMFLNFAVTMLYPVFTQETFSVHEKPLPRLFQASSFIPLAFLFWNTGDFLGRLSTALPRAKLGHRPKLLLAFAVARLIWLPLYLMCNLNGKGAVISSDFFYLVVVQFGFGLSNGWLGATCLIGAPLWVGEEEREAAGGFMGLVLIGGLTLGSLLSFAIAAI